MAFNLGSMGFLTPFSFNAFREQVTQVLEGNGYALPHWGRDKMAAIFQTTFADTFSITRALTAEIDRFPRVSVGIWTPHSPMLIKISADNSSLNQLPVKNLFFSIIIKTFYH